MINPESFAHHFRKLQADGVVRNASTTTTTTSTNLSLPPPPAYTPSATLPLPSTRVPHADDVDDEDDEDDDDAEVASGAMTTITVSAPVRVVGHGNILNTSSLASMLSTSLATALQQHEQQLQSAAAAVEASDDHHPIKADARGESPKKAMRSLCINVNCGVSIVGSRNVVGESVAQAALAARMTAISAAAAAASPAGVPASGTKRSAEKAIDDGAPPAKKVHPNE